MKIFNSLEEMNKLLKKGRTTKKAQKHEHHDLFYHKKEKLKQN
jgi:hypothetical protein